MEQVFFRLHVRLIRFVTPLLTPQIRKLLEKFVFLNAVLSLCLLIWLHTMYVNYPQSASSNCLYQELVTKNITGNVADFDVIRVHISNDWFHHQDTYRSDGSDGMDRCERNGHCSASMSSRGDRQRTDKSSPSEKLPVLFDSFISSIGMHIHDSQHSAPRYESSGRGGGSARLFSVAERLLSSPGPTAASSANTEANEEASIDTDEHEIDPTESVDDKTGVHNSGYMTDNEIHTASKISTRSTPTTEMANILLDLFVSQRVYLFSLEKGYLMLHPDERDRHDIRRLDLTIARDNVCFGPPSSAWLVHSFIGYDTVVMNWAISTFGGRGYLYNIYSKELFNLNFAADSVEKTGAAPVLISSKRSESAEKKGTSFRRRMFLWLESQTQRTRGGKLVQFSFSGLRHFLAFKTGVIFSTLFLFFTTTTLVSFTLRETQERMLKFTFLLQHHVSHRIPYASLVFTHVVESLVFVPIMVGILFFLFEFFSDQLLAFMVLSVVWLSEIFSVISLRTFPSISFFPRAFFFYFSLFHIYFFSFPFGFSYLALFTTVLFILHSMVYCWNSYEVPALESGLITALTLRVGMGTSVQDLRTGPTHIPPMHHTEQEQRLSAISTASSDANMGQSQNIPSPAPSVQSPFTPLTVDLSPEGLFGPYSGESSGPFSIPRRPRSSTEPDFDHEVQLRDAYSRHVELSRRIQQEQLSAMLGIHVPQTAASTHSHSLPPSPYRSRASSAWNNTPSSSPLPGDAYEDVTSNSNDAVGSMDNNSVLSYPMAVIGMGLSWFGVGNRTQRNHENESRIQSSSRSSEILYRSSRPSSQDAASESRQYRATANTAHTFSQPSTGGFRSIRNGIISPVTTPARNQVINRSGSGEGRGSDKSMSETKNGDLSNNKSPSRRILQSLSRSSKDLSSCEDLGLSLRRTGSGSGRGVGSTVRTPLGISKGSADRGDKGERGIIGVMDVDEIAPDKYRKSSSKRGREVKGQSSGRDGPSKYLHNELVMYNSDFDMADELLRMDVARGLGASVPVFPSTSCDSLPIQAGAGARAGVEGGNKGGDGSAGGYSKNSTVASSDEYFLHNPYDTNPSTVGSRRSTQSSIDVDDALRSAKDIRVPHTSPHPGKRSPSSSSSDIPGTVVPSSILLTASECIEKSQETAGKPFAFPTLHSLLGGQPGLQGSKSSMPNGALLVPVGAAATAAGGSASNILEEKKQSGKRSPKSRTSRSILSSRDLGGSMSLGSLCSSSSGGGGEYPCLPSLVAPPAEVITQNRSDRVENIPSASFLAAANSVVSPTRRVPSVNDFGYRRSDFNMFGNDFNEED